MLPFILILIGHTVQPAIHLSYSYYHSLLLSCQPQKLNWLMDVLFQKRFKLLISIMMVSNELERAKATKFDDDHADSAIL